MIKKYKNDINSTKEYIKNIIYTPNNEVNEIVQEYFSIGGKALRPLLTLICSNLGTNKNKEKTLQIAAIIEIIHTTTLIHDDIIDGAFDRRGVKTLNNLYNNSKALFIGDFLFSKILNEVAKIDNIEIHNYLSKTLKNLCFGELIQYNDLYNINTRKLKYLKKIRNKTAILIAFSCAAGALINDAKKDDVIASYKFGYYLGMSYQLIDDYLDFVGNKKNLGKDIGQDLINGNITYPIILKIKDNPDKFNNYKNKSLLEKEQLIKEIKNDAKILSETLNLSKKYLNKAKEAINNIDDITKKDLLYVLEKLHNRNN